MLGMNRTTGKSMDGLDHLIQSIQDILTTPIGTRCGGLVSDANGARVHVREYGCEQFDLIDSPLSAELLIDLYAAVAKALDQWEPRFRLTRVANVTVTPDGHASMDMIGKVLDTGETVTLERIVA